METKEMNITNLFYKDLIFCNLKCKNRKELFAYLTEKLVQKGIAKDSFLEGLEKREKEFPTGINTNHINVAIPHTNIEHVKKAAILVATLEKPVKFFQMDKPDQTIDVDIVFLLAINDPDQQVHLLTNMVSIFENKKLLEELKNSDLKGEVFNKLICYFNDEQ